LSGGVSFCSNQGFGGDTGAKSTATVSDGAFGKSGKIGNEGNKGSESVTERPPSCLYFGDCEAWGWPDSPIIIDLDGKGFSLTSADDGVNFDLNVDGVAERLSWTAPASDDAFLALDLNQNGVIDSGAELFGNYTPQPPSANPNGFLALAEFDKLENGGSGDGRIDEEDAVFARLRLWQDSNHNGRCDAGELRTLTEVGVLAISLEYQWATRRDQYGNLFLYRGKIQLAKRATVERWAYDVFLVRGF